MTDLFYAFPSNPESIGACIKQAERYISTRCRELRVQLWPELEISGRFLATEVLDQIRQCETLLADITRLNFNVTYEVGFAIGCGKPVLLTRNVSLEDEGHLRKELGIFDTLGYQEYENAEQLYAFIESQNEKSSLYPEDSQINATAPVYILEPKFKTDHATRIVSRVKKARLFFRSYDPSEHPRLSAHEAINGVAESIGVVIQLLDKDQSGARLNNLRAAFLSGLAHGMRKECVILQSGDDPVPIDYRDFVSSYTHPEQIDDEIARFAENVVEALQARKKRGKRSPKSVLASITLGSSSAENEFRDLDEYYVETAAFQRAERGEARLVVGRKGAGKTALFAQLRNKIRRARKNIVLDLKPEGYKLRKFNEEVGGLLSGGAQEHTIMAFWEYLLLLEVCHKILDKDRVPHTRDHSLFEKYTALSEAYESDAVVSIGDFSERMASLLEQIQQDFFAEYREGFDQSLTRGQITEVIYRHDIAKLRSRLHHYMESKGQLWILIDNLDKGWPAQGITAEDLIVIRMLMEATRKIERDFDRARQECHATVFLRNDVFELLVDAMPDRGKESKIVLDWSDPDLLRELLRRRLIFNDQIEDVPFEEIWPEICVSHIDGEESSQWLIERCLMRPRFLLDLIDHCKAHAVNLQKSKIDVADLRHGFESFSSDLLVDIGYEVRDVVDNSEDLLYEFLGVSPTLSSIDFELILSGAGVGEEESDALVDVLLWYGFIGISGSEGQEKYIYDVSYDIKRLKAALRKIGKDRVLFHINPAFWPALEIGKP